MLGEGTVQEGMVCKDNIQDRAVIPEHILKEFQGLTIHR